MDVGVAQLHVCPGDAVDGLEESAELPEASRAASLQTEATILRLKLVRTTPESSQSAEAEAGRPATGPPAGTARLAPPCEPDAWTQL